MSEPTWLIATLLRETRI